MIQQTPIQCSDADTHTGNLYWLLTTKPDRSPTVCYEYEFERRRFTSLLKRHNSQHNDNKPQVVINPRVCNMISKQEIELITMKVHYFLTF